MGAIGFVCKEVPVVVFSFRKLGYMRRQEERDKIDLKGKNVRGRTGVIPLGRRTEEEEDLLVYQNTSLSPPERHCMIINRINQIIGVRSIFAPVGRVEKSAFARFSFVHATRELRERKELLVYSSSYGAWLSTCVPML